MSFVELKRFTKENLMHIKIRKHFHYLSKEKLIVSHDKIYLNEPKQRS